MFSKKEILDILEKLGYQIVKEKDQGSSIRSKYFNKNAKYKVEIDGELVDPETVFKKELLKRIFNI